MARTIVCGHCKAVLNLTMEGDRLVSQVVSRPKLTSADDDLEAYIRGGARPAPQAGDGNDQDADS